MGNVISVMPSLKVLKYRWIGGDDYGTENRYLLTIGGPARINIADLKRALHDEFDTHCHHDYDCCGNWYTNVWTHSLRRTKSGEWTVRLTRAMNV